MAVTWSLLADGIVAASEGIIYTSAGQTWLKAVTLCNTHATLARTVTLWLRRGAGTSRRIRVFNLDALGGAGSFNGEGIAMGAGDSLRAAADDGTSVDFTVSGGTQ